MRGASAKYYRLAKRQRPRFQFGAFVVIYTIGSFWAVAETGTRFCPQFGVDGGNWPIGEWRLWSGSALKVPRTGVFTALRRKRTKAKAPPSGHFTASDNAMFT
jgi:hypothetical protein